MTNPKAEKAHMEMCGSVTLPDGRVVPGCHIDTDPAADQATESDHLPTLVPVNDSRALRDYLDALNEAGIDYKAAGIDSRGVPFLITLIGAYADSEHVFYGSPWDGEVDYDTAGEACAECGAANPHLIDTVRYPAYIVQAPTEDGVFSPGGDVRVGPGSEADRG